MDVKICDKPFKEHCTDASVSVVTSEILHFRCFICRQIGMLCARGGTVWMQSYVQMSALPLHAGRAARHASQTQDPCRVLRQLGLQG